MHGNPVERDEPNPFVQMLWEHGNVHEDAIVAKLPVADLSGLDAAARPFRSDIVAAGRRYVRTLSPKSAAKPLC